MLAENGPLLPAAQEKMCWKLSSIAQQSASIRSFQKTIVSFCDVQTRCLSYLSKKLHKALTGEQRESFIQEQVCSS